jgi:arylsulfatase A-like enzyme
MMQPKKIIFISIDTLRADHLGCYGYQRRTSPVIDSLAKTGVIFKNAFSPSSFTIPAHASIFTGKYPSHHSIGFNQGTGKLNTDIDITLAEYLKTKGLKTAAFVSSFVLRKQTNLDSGFDLYDDEMTSAELNRPAELIRDGSETSDRAMTWICTNKDDNFFVFLHLFDVHGPYACKEPYKSMFRNDVYNKRSEKLNSVVPDNHPIGGIPFYQVLKKILDKEGNIISFETSLQYYISQYDGNIRYCDSVIGKLITVLQDLQIFDEVTLIITSDHGEAFGENNIFFFHGLTVTPEQIHVPLILKPAKSFTDTQRRICDPVTTLDIFPTIMSLFGDDPVLFNTEGKSLFNCADEKFSGNNENRIISPENEGQVAIIKKDEPIVIKKKEKPSEPKMLFIPELIESLDNSEYPWNFGDSDFLETNNA